MPRSGLRAAVSCATHLGLKVTAPDVLSERSNLVVHLRPAEVVAYVATVTGEVRGHAAFDSYDRAVHVARHLEARAAPSTPLATQVPPGPHRHDGFAMCFFERVHHEPARGPDPEGTAEALRAVHSALRENPLNLPRLVPLAELPPLLHRLGAEGLIALDESRSLDAMLTRARADIDGLGLTDQPIHGDASLGNVHWTHRGPVWSDFEDASSGPIEWDLACLVGTGRAFGRPRLGSEETLLAYGAPRDAVLRPFIVARAVQSLAWGLFIGRRHPDTDALARRRLSEWLSGGADRLEA